MEDLKFVQFQYGWRMIYDMRFQQHCLSMVAYFYDIAEKSSVGLERGEEVVLSL